MRTLGCIKVLVACVVLLSLMYCVLSISYPSGGEIDSVNASKNRAFVQPKAITTPEGRFTVKNVIKTPVRHGWFRTEPAARRHYDVMPEWTKPAPRNLTLEDKISHSLLIAKNRSDISPSTEIIVSVRVDSPTHSTLLGDKYGKRVVSKDIHKLKLKVKVNDLLKDNSNILYIDKLAGSTGVKYVEPLLLPLERFESNNPNRTLATLTVYAWDETKKRKLESIQGVKVVRILHTGDVQVFAPENYLKELAKLDFVESISNYDEILYELNNAVLMAAVDEAKSYYASTYGKDLDGGNIKLAVIDHGYDETNPYLKEPTVKVHYYDCDGDLCTDDDITDNDGHGTHVAGIIVNNHSTYSGVAEDVDLYFFKIGYSGVLGRAELIKTAIEDAVYTYQVDLISISIKDNFNPSDGTDTVSRVIDDAARNGTIVFVSAGNQDQDGVTSFGSAKSVITVGATTHWGDVSDFYTAPNADRDAVAWYSSWGDTSDGRDKPDIVAPGGDHSSTSSCGSEYGMVSTRANNTGDNVCSPESDMIKMVGTSMAAPFAAGVSALLLNASGPELFPIPEERAADLKALLLATAVKVNISEDGEDSGNWSDEMGHGRVDFHNALLWDAAGTFTRGGMVFGDELGSGDYSITDFYVPEGTTYLKVVVAWSDPPTSELIDANGYECALLNDLDLTVTDPEEESYVSVSECNPVEFIELYDEDGLPGGNYTIEVVGDSSRFNSDSQVYGGAAFYYFSKPELRVTSFSKSKGTVSPGESFTLSASVVNMGNGNLPGVDLNLSYDKDAFDLVDGEENPLLGTIGGYTGRFYERSYTWTLEAKEDATRSDYDFTVYAVDSTENYFSNTRTESVRILEYELTPTLEYESFNVPPQSYFDITVHVNNTGDLNATDVNATLSPGGLTSVDDLTQTIDFIEIGTTEDVTWNVSAESENTYPFTVEVTATPYDLQYSNSVLGCVAVSSDGTNYCSLLYNGWNLISVPLDSE